MSEHTKLPWHATRKSVYVSDTNHNCLVQMLRNQEQNEANAALIVKAVNNHEALVEALKFTVECLEGHSFSRGIDPRTATPASAIGQARGVLSRVEGRLP